MGLGKTLQAIGLANLVAQREGIKRILVVTLASLKINWSREIAKWTTFPCECAIAEGAPPTSLDDLFKTPQARILVINYDLLVRWGHLLLASQWSLYVADEAHSLKNPKAQRSVVGLSINAARKVFLTGSPIDDKPVELWPLISYLQPRHYSDFWDYAQRYCDPKRKKAGRDRVVWDFGGRSNIDELAKNLRRFVMIRRKKDDVLKELPPKIRQIIELPSDSVFIGDELRLFASKERDIESLRVAVDKAILADDIKAYEKAAKALKQNVNAVCDAMGGVRRELALAKVPLACAHIQNLIDSGKKVLVFAIHQSVVDAMHRHFGDIAVKVHGDVDKKLRQPLIDLFQNDPKIRLFVGGIGACGTGHNLTEANVVVFLEMPWEPSKILQAEDRAHRIGQRGTVVVQYLVVQGSIDARIAAMVARKMEHSREILDGDPVEGDVILFPWSSKSICEEFNPDALEQEGKTIPATRRMAIIRALKHICDHCDTGRWVDNHGFSNMDAPVGHDLAGRSSLTNKQAALGLRFVRRYHRQIPDALLHDADPSISSVSGAASTAAPQIEFGFVLQKAS